MASLSLSIACQAGELADNIRSFSVENDKSQILMIPGLNFKPEALHPLINELNQKSISVHLISISFSSEADRAWEDGDLKKDWVLEVDRAIELVNTLSVNKKQKFKVVAYSLGALLTELSLAKDVGNTNHSNLTELNYLAPALFLRASVTAGLKLAYVLPDSWEIVSLNLEFYQTRGFTYVGEYLALDQLVKELQSRELTDVNPFRTNLLMSPGDELLLFDEISAWLRATRNEVGIYPVKNGESEGLLGKKHLIVDEASLGKEEFSLLVDVISATQ